MSNATSRAWRMAFLVLLISQPLLAQEQPDLVTIEFSLVVPNDTPEDATIFLAGDAAELGNWRADGLELRRGDDGLYVGEVRLPRGGSVAFKATRGSWATVEKSLSGGEIANRTLLVGQDGRVSVVVAAWADRPAARRVSTRTGDIRLHAGFYSKVLDNHRTLRVYLPPGYDTDGDRRYPVLYMHDGQNLFDAATSFAGVEWSADETAQRLILAEEIEPIIIVGIDHTLSRMTEYTPRPDGESEDAYTRFVVQEVVPFIETTYRAEVSGGKRAVGGSSLGGLMSLYLAGAYPELFGRCAAMSPSLWWSDRWLLEAWREAWPEGLSGVRIWVDIGTREGGQQVETGEPGQAVLNTRALVELLDEAGLSPDQDYRYVEAEGAWHNEQAWAERFEGVLRFFYGL